MPVDPNPYESPKSSGPPTKKSVLQLLDITGWLALAYAIVASLVLPGFGGVRISGVVVPMSTVGQFFAITILVIGVVLPLIAIVRHSTVDRVLAAISLLRIGFVAYNSAVYMQF